MQSHLLRKCTEREKIKTNGETVQKDGGEGWTTPMKTEAMVQNWIIFRFSGEQPPKLLICVLKVKKKKLKVLTEESEKNLVPCENKPSVPLKLHSVLTEKKVNFWVFF